ncbi:universal stress protein [Chitinophaga rhizophila]|uniref:Universal stress protein n=1 Tax=Chitinophaga rhizophila TaxID=2866212 RepID=A0ABS7GCJ9_9BACT|nr:universal stress protein [Chitinophaga rhizophila]MBW8684524.1 universal stress protein [Chitinophaga rhizophila]
MQSILVLTDFSDVALQAAKYAVRLAARLQCNRVLLLNAYQSLEPIANVPVSPELPIIQANPDELYKGSSSQLEVLRKRLEPEAAGITIETLAEDDILEEAVKRVVAREHAGLVVAGIADKSNLEKFLVGSHSIRIMENCEYPLVIVPEDSRLLLPQRILLAVDFEVLREGKALPGLVTLLNSLQPEALFAVNVAGDDEYSPEAKQDIAQMHQLLEKYPVTFHYLKKDDVTEGITDFATANNIALIIALHEKKGLLATLFQKSVSKQLAWNSNVPLLILPA